jgi:hypothetical protein
MTDNIDINYKSDNFITYTDKVLNTIVMYEIYKNELVVYSKLENISYSGLEELHRKAELEHKRLSQSRSYI